MELQKLTFKQILKKLKLDYLTEEDKKNRREIDLNEILSDNWPENMSVYAKIKIYFLHESKDIIENIINERSLDTNFDDFDYVQLMKNYWAYDFENNDLNPHDKAMNEIISLRHDYEKNYYNENREKYVSFYDYILQRKFNVKLTEEDFNYINLEGYYDLWIEYNY